MAESTGEANDVIGGDNPLGNFNHDALDRISSSQDALNAAEDHEVLHDAQDFANHMEDDYEQALKIVDSQYKRNKIVSFAKSVQEDIDAIKDALLDQIQSSLIEEDLQDLLGKSGAYFNMMGSLMDIPDNLDLEKSVKDFTKAQKPEFDALKRETKDLR